MKNINSGCRVVLAAADDIPLGKVRQKLIKSLELRKVCGIGVIPNEYLKHLPRRPQYIRHNYLIIVFGCRFFQSLGRTQK
jgi:hypothetical protein